MLHLVRTSAPLAAFAFCSALVVGTPANASTASLLHLFKVIASDDESPKENIGALVAFDPQAGLRGVRPTTLDLSDPTRPVLTNLSTGGAFDFMFDFQGLGDGAVDLPPAPDADGHTGFTQRIGGHLLDVTFTFGPGVVDAANWSSFNPQPDPPGDVLGVGFQFRGFADPYAAFSAKLDGNVLSFAAVPEPSTWLMMILGFGGLGGLMRTRSRPALRQTA
jgi:hypothetical protein